MFAVVDLYGSTEAVSITSLGKTILSPNDAEDSSHSPVHRVSPTKESHVSLTLYCSFGVTVTAD